MYERKDIKYAGKNSRIDLKDMAVMLGMTEVEVANEIADMEKNMSSAVIIP